MAERTAQRGSSLSLRIVGAQGLPQHHAAIPVAPGSRTHDRPSGCGFTGEFLPKKSASIVPALPGRRCAKLVYGPSCQLPLRSVNPPESVHQAQLIQPTYWMPFDFAMSNTARPPIPTVTA